MKRQAVKMWTTFFYCGQFPAAPGTFTSAVAAVIAYLLSGHFFLYVLFTTVITVIGFRLSGLMEKIMKTKDPGCVVIDEVSGVMISFLFLPMTPAVIMTAFFLFRAFDMFKIYPANKLEEKGGGAGIMLDDIMAGVYTNLVMQVAVRIAGVG